MLVLSVWLHTRWHDLTDTVAARSRRDDGEVTATMAMIAVLVVAAIAAAGIIANKMQAHAIKVPDP